MALGGNLVLMETVKFFRMTSDEAPEPALNLFQGGRGMRYALPALPRRRLLWAALALGLLLLTGCATSGPKKHNALGNKYTDQARFMEAEKEYREAIRLKPDFAEAHHGLGLVLMVRDREGGLNELREAIRLKPDFLMAIEDLARRLDRLGRHREARPYWERALKLEKKPWVVDEIKKRLAEPR
jgi:tetratricopeptide (TPR) repeat protein